MTGVDPRPLGLASMRRWRLSRDVRRLRPGLVGDAAEPLHRLVQELSCTGVLFLVA